MTQTEKKSEQTSSSLDKGPAADDYNIFEDEKQKKADADVFMNKMQNKSTLETADYEQNSEIWESSNQEKPDNSLENKEEERERLKKKSAKHDKYSRFSSKIGRFRDGIKHAATEAQEQKSAGYAAGNLVTADALALEYYDNEIAAKEVADGTLTPTKENRQPSTKGIFTEKFSNSFEYSATKPAKKFETQAKVDAKESNTSEEKNKTDSLLINQYFLIAKGLGKSTKTEDEEKVKKLYTYAKLRKFDIAERTKRELEKKEKLEKDKRVVKILSRTGLANATRDAIGGVIVSLIFRKGGSSNDDRGIRGGTNFKLTEDEEGNKNIETEKIKAGKLIPPSKSITQQLEDVGEKWNKKILLAKNASSGAAFFIHFSSFLEAFQSVMKIGSGVLSTINTYLVGLAVVIPPLAAVTVVLSPIIKSVTTIMKLIDKILTGARTIFDGLAMMLNDNPALFSLLKGGAINSLGASVSAGASIGFDELNKDIKFGKGAEQAAAADKTQGVFNLDKATNTDGTDFKRDNPKFNFKRDGAEIKSLGGVDWWERQGETVAAAAAGGGEGLVTDVAIPEGIKAFDGKGLNPTSAAHADEAFNGKGRGVNENMGANLPTSDNNKMNYEEGEEEIAKEAFVKAIEESDKQKSRLSSHIKKAKFNEDGVDKTNPEGKNGKELSDNQKKNLKNSKGAWSTAKKKINEIFGPTVQDIMDGSFRERWL